MNNFVIKRPMSSLAILLLLLFCVVLLYVTQPLLWVKKASSTSTVSAARLRAHVEKLCGPSLFPRHSSQPANLDLAAEYIRSELTQARGRVSDQPFTVEGKSYRNVISLFGPDTKERIVVGAHYDAAGKMPGADDNASGIAGLIELAYLLGNSALPLKVELVAYTLEEPPYFRTPNMGSAFHAQALKRENAIVRAMLALEMIGYFSDNKNSQDYPVGLLSFIYPNQGNFIAVVGKVGQASIVRNTKQAMSDASSLPVYSLNGPGSIPGIDFSDHLNYWQVGYQAAMISDTAFYRNANYHKATDTPEKLDYQRMAQVVEGIYAAVKHLSQ